MFKGLLKKQLLSFAAFFTQAKDGKRRSPVAIVGFSVLMLFALYSMCFLTYEMGNLLCAPLLSQGLGWLYFAFMGALATALGIVGTMFMAKASLYEAKDNELLLSMPIPSWLILFTRIAGLYAFTLLFEGIVFLPATIAYLVTVGFSMSTLLLSLLCLLIMPLGALSVCCVLGWLLALLAAKLPWKNLLTTLFSVAFLIGYFAVYSKLNEYLTYVVVNGGVIAEKMKTWLFPFWQLGLACVGEGLGLLWYSLLFIGVFSLVYLLLSKTYLRLATANKGGKKAKYKSKEGKQSSVFATLLKKEGMRFTKNPMIALNCLLGTVFLFILPFAALFMEELTVGIRSSNVDEIIAMLLAVIVCAVASMNMISAASVSLEGENLWIARSMPVRTEMILLAKASFHFLATAIPALFAAVFLGIYYRLGVGYTLAAVTVVVAFSAYAAFFGLLVNLKMPNLHWTNELVAVKQSFSAVVGMFTEWGALLLLVGGYFLFGKYMFAGGYFLVCIALLLAADALLWVWHCRRGTKIFENL